MQMQSGTTTATMPFSGLPGSPTLTNPDMILPYDGEYDTTPGQSTFTQDEWRDPLDMDFSLGPSQISPAAPSTPIIYGNGTMLSDIGEVTEAESTAAGGRKLPGPAERRMLKQAQASNTPIRSSPTIGYEAVMKRAKTGNHQRSVSIESTSTVTSEGHAAEMFRDFDDEVSVDDSNFQGDDEESVAESYRDSYREEVIGQETQRLAKGANGTREEDDEDFNSSAALSRRAEQILFNAKKRLNNMEGNLTRARSSLFVTPSRSASSIHSSSPLSRSTPSPPVNQFSTGPSKHRQLNTPLDSPIGTPGHSRVYSENSINATVGKGRFPIRSASAAARYIPNTAVDDGQRRLGVSYSSDSLREDLKIAARPTLSSPLSRTSPPRAIPLEPLTEDDPVPEFDSQSVTPSIDGFISPSGEQRGLTRSASTTQMRDLRYQMHDLKGRLSVLRDRARDDTMKRRSLQSLRTPSPFTAAEQWYATDKGYQENPLSADAGTSPILSQAGDQTNGLFSPNTDSSGQDGTRDLPEFEGSDVTSVYEDIEDERHFTSVPKRSDELQAQEGEDLNQAPEPIEEEVEEDEGDYVDEIVNVDEAEDYESDNTLYHDTFDHPISHEDREDAFDYEHFFLHSAMGTIGAVARNRRDSCSSEDSVETTRGPTLQKPKSPQKQAYDSRPVLTHWRSGSNASVSTIESFATAEEDPSSGDDDVDTPREEKHQDFAVREARQASTLKSPSSTVKRSTFGGSPMDLGLPDEVQTISGLQEPPHSAVNKPEEGDGTGAHRTSVSSFDSCSSGSTRSFPLVNKPKIREPIQPAPHPAASRGSGGSGGSLITSYSATLVDRQSGIDQERLQTSPVHMLAKDDQILVERLVASLGKCVLGLQEADRGTYESRVWRRRLDAARRVLEGTEGAI
ncbi:hypothetical protein BJ875DRAFT_13080 [Amylocarpus encephaloides]|uniref:Uncharacterized protein n=1 Tax=Amylocarpus encephaloides TaxID=45428 RepID=A0A9P7YRP2_9HELO|nr:hypothetical protein BJ875DRAFT_13080 [Amylocarpus encephaloides]